MQCFVLHYILTFDHLERPTAEKKSINKCLQKRKARSVTVLDQIGFLFFLSPIYELFQK